MNVHARLEEERKRLGKGQEEMAACGLVKLRTYANYASGLRVPDADFLSAIAAAGADVQYILTGQRSANAPLPADESLLLDGYRASSPETRQAALRVLLGGDVPAPAKTKTKTIKVTGDGNQAAGRDLIHQQGVDSEGSKPAGRRKR